MLLLDMLKWMGKQVTPSAVRQNSFLGQEYWGGE